MEKMKAEVTAFRPIFRLLCCRRGLRKNFRGLRPRNLTPKKLSRAVKNLPVPAYAILRGTDLLAADVFQLFIKSSGGWMGKNTA